MSLLCCILKLSLSKTDCIINYTFIVGGVEQNKPRQANKYEANKMNNTSLLVKKNKYNFTLFIALRFTNPSQILY